MADVFISYSRTDEAFVELLREALAEDGRDVWVDREDIGPAVEWRREIELGIEGADVFAFVITPEALRSEPCEREREHAVAQKKRIVPLLRLEPEDGEIPDELASRNFIFFRTDEEFAPGLASLLAAIENLPAWARAHTRLLERAQQWDRADREQSFLLRGTDLRDAERWLSEQGAHKEPQATPLQTEYLLASRKAATRRQRITIGAVLAALVIAVVLAIVALKQRNEAVQQAQVARSRELAPAAVAKLPVDPELSVLLADEAASVSPTSEAEEALRRALAFSHLQITLRGHEDWISHAAFSPDGERVVTASRDGRAGLWDAATGAEVAWLKGHRGQVSWVAFSDDGRLIATASRDGTARLWDGATGEPRARLDEHQDAVTSVAFSPDGRRLVTSSEDGTARVWDPATAKPLVRLGGHRRSVTDADFTADGGTIVTASAGGTVTLWHATSGAQVAKLRIGGGAIRTLAVSPAGHRMFAASWGEQPVAVIADVRTGAELRPLPSDQGLVTAAAFSFDGTRLATGNIDGTVRVWSAARGELRATLVAHTGGITDLSFNRRGTLLASASIDQSAKIWDIEAQRAIEDLRGHDGGVFTAAFAPNGRTILTTGEDATARIWDAGGTPEELFTKELLTTASFAPDGRHVLFAGLVPTTLWELPPRAAPPVELPLQLVTDANVSPDGSRIVTAGGDGVARVWSTSGAFELQEDLSRGDAPLHTAVFSPDGKTVLTSSDDRTARLWELETGDVRKLERHTEEVADAEFSRDGTRIVTAGWDQTARIWDSASGEQLKVLRGHDSLINAASFSPDGRFVVTGSGDETARIWDLASGKTRFVLTGHTEPIVAARFSPDGATVLTASVDGTARVWDAATGEQLLDLLGDGFPLSDAGFDPSGRRIVTAGLGAPRRGAERRGQPTLRIYRCEACGSLADLQAAADDAVTRGLTASERSEFLGE